MTHQPTLITAPDPRNVCPFTIDQRGLIHRKPHMARQIATRKATRRASLPVWAAARWGR